MEECPHQMAKYQGNVQTNVDPATNITILSSKQKFQTSVGLSNQIGACQVYKESDITVLKKKKQPSSKDFASEPNPSDNPCWAETCRANASPPIHS